MFFRNPFRRRLPRNRGYRLKEIFDRDARIREIIEKFEEKSSNQMENKELDSKKNYSDNTNNK
ncbi:hypothetical protein DRQ26_01130 [bacterium]|nr:MAG: hypothetical protein DRQ26_01130 [bacterium]